MVTVCEGLLRTLEPQEPKEKQGYDIEKIKWENAEGEHGAFQKSMDVNSLDHKLLLKDVQAHRGKMTVAGFFVWVFQDGSTLGRKKRSF